jgi:phosphatidate cytidylyltransferase
VTSTRIISAVFIAVLLLLAVLALPPWWSAAALTLILLAATWEWSAFVDSRPATRLAYSAAVISLCLLWWVASRTPAGLLLLLWAAFAYWCIATIWLVLGRRPTRALIIISGLLALSFAWIALVRVRVDWEEGAHVVLYALLIVWLADSGAYFAGRQWGGAKLAPSISPGKTWAGLWGGLAVCVLLAIGVSIWRDLPLLPLLAVTLVTGVFSVVGDLTESLAKRFAGVKDSGHLIPGHGGVLDRFDSLLAAAPVLALGIVLLPGLHG